MQYITLDSYKHYTQARLETADGQSLRETHIAHGQGALQQFLAGCELDSPVAVETVGNWY
jgi:hypothetical protein